MNNAFIKRHPTCVCTCTCMHYALERECFAHLQSNRADLALVRQNCGVPLLVCPVFPRQFCCIMSVCLTYLCTVVYFLEKSAACGVSVSDREGRPCGWRPTFDTEIHVHTLSCGIKLTLHAFPAARWERLHVCSRLTQLIKSNVYSMWCTSVHA